MMTHKIDFDIGDIIEAEGCEFKIVDAEDHHIRTIEVKRFTFPKNLRAIDEVFAW